MSSETRHGRRFLCIAIGAPILIATVMSVPANGETIRSKTWSVTIDEHPPADFTAAARTKLSDWFADNRASLAETATSPWMSGVGNYGMADPGDFDDDDGEIVFFRLADDIGPVTKFIPFEEVE